VEIDFAKRGLTLWRNGEYFANNRQALVSG